MFKTITEPKMIVLFFIFSLVSLIVTIVDLYLFDLTGFLIGVIVVKNLKRTEFFKNFRG